MPLRAVEVPFRAEAEEGAQVKVIGNTAAVEALNREFPRAALLWGPPSVGKWTAAEFVRAEHKIFEPDVLRIPRLGMTEAHEAVAFSQCAPSQEHGRACLISLDHASPGAADVLLKAVEDAGPHMHFLMVAARPVPQTLRDRARIYRFGLLTQGEVQTVLTEVRKMATPLAHRLAEQSGGQVKTALDALVVADDKALVLAMLRALREGDQAALDALADRWRDEHTKLLARWATEAVSRQWRTFSEAETGIDLSLALRVLTVLRRDVRPRLVVRALLASVLRAQHQRA